MVQNSQQSWRQFIEFSPPYLSLYLLHPQTHISSIKPKTHVTDRHILHPQTNMSLPVGKNTNTNRHCVRTNKTKNTCHTQTHTAYADTTLTRNTQHTYKTKNTAISVQPFSCIFQPGVIQQDEKEAIETLRPVVMKKVGFNLTQWGFRQMRKLFIDCLGSCLPSVLTQEQQRAGNVVDENVSWLRT